MTDRRANGHIPVLTEPPADAAGRLSERMRYGIAHRLGWDALRPVQEISVDRILDGDNCVILAPTAGGKTEAAFLPILDRIRSDSRPPVACIYVSPLRALLNNQEERVAELAGLVGLRSFKWHGDVDQSARKRFLDEPTDVLLTTPESLEVMLLSSRVHTPELFAGLAYIIVDEVHNFAEGDRGSHLLSVTERLQKVTDHDIQRIGLSATVGNPVEMAQWLQGSSARPMCVIDPARAPKKKRLAVRWLADGLEVGGIAANIVTGKKALFFVDSRAGVEETKARLDQLDLPAYVHHSSVSKESRETAEGQFAQMDECCIVCTSSLELGIDIGDLDVILQLDAPTRVSSYLQRLGRTGRRDAPGHIEFICTSDWALLLAVALIRLANKGWVESVPCPRRAHHVLIHQILAKVREHWGVSRRRLKADLAAPTCFAGIAEQEFDQILDYLVQTDTLHLADGLFSFGEEGEKRWAPKNFLDLYSVFETPALAKVVTQDGKEVGTLETWFVQATDTEEFVFVLSGQKWRVVDVNLDEDPGRVVVTRAPAGMPPKWMGHPALIGREVAEEHRAIVLGRDEPEYVLGRGIDRLRLLREEWVDLLRGDPLPIVESGRDIVIHTFAGGRANNALGRLLEIATQLETSMDNFQVTLRNAMGSELLPEAVGVMLRQLAFGPPISQTMRRQCAANLPRYRLSKFQPYLPPDLEAEFLAERLLDFDEMVEVLRDRLGDSGAP